MSKKLVNAHYEAIVYLKDTDGDYVLDTDGEKIVVKTYSQVKPTDDYDVKTTITEY
jgi:hypothetical protein